MCARTAAVHRRGHARGDRRADGQSANSDGPEPDRLQPSAPASPAARLMTRQARHERRPARLRDGVLERAGDQREVARVQTVDERAEVGPLPDRVGERDRVAEQRARPRGLDLEVRVHDDRRQAGRHRQPDDIGRIGAADEHEAAADARRDVVGMRRSGAEPLAFERARDQRLDRRVRADQRVDRHDRRRRAGRAAAEPARQRQPLANASATRRAARRASSGAPAPPRRRCCAPPRAAGGRRRRGCSRSARRTRRKRGRDFVAGRFQREPEHIEAARDVRHGRWSKGGDSRHEA